MNVPNVIVYITVTRKWTSSAGPELGSHYFLGIGKQIQAMETFGFLIIIVETN